MKFWINDDGFTLIETAVVLGIIFILLALTAPVYRFFEMEGDLTNGAEEIVNALRLAQDKTMASENASRWGVYFSTSTNQYTLFRGNSYAARTISLDEVRNLPKTVEFYGVDLTGGSEVVFERVTGNANSTGNVSVRQKTDSSRTKTIYVESSGQISQTATLAPSDDNRKKDSRHVHFDYSRSISTSSEILILNFNYGASTTTQDIVISENIKDNQIYWYGEITVDGEIQKLKIHTHRLNNPDTLFSIQRDMRYNTKALSIEIGDSPDPDIGTLIAYDASGTVSTGTSIYVSNFQTQ